MPENEIPELVEEEVDVEEAKMLRRRAARQLAEEEAVEEVVADKAPKKTFAQKIGMKK